MPFNPVTESFHTDDLNRFCLNKKVLQTNVEFFQDCGNVYWSVLIEFDTIIESARSEIEGLTEAGKICFEKLRDRKSVV